MRRGRIVIRADADPAIGIGHIGRGLALADAWRRSGGEACLVATAPLAAGAETWIRSTGLALDILPVGRYSEDDARATASIADGAPVIVDVFGTPPAFRSAVRRLVRRLAIIDDAGGPGPWSAEVIVNQNYGADAAFYPQRDPRGALLLGPRYALLRPEFARWRNLPRRRDNTARRIVVSLGGTDPKNAISLVFDALQELPGDDWRAFIVAGVANPRAGELKARAKAGGRQIHVLQRPGSMARLLTWSDVSILASGVTVWEALCLGVPTIGIAVADNQMPGAKALTRDRLWSYLGSFEDVAAPTIVTATRRLLDDTAERRRLSDAGRATVDGLGAERVADALAVSFQ